MRNLRLFAAVFAGFLLVISGYSFLTDREVSADSKSGYLAFEVYAEATSAGLPFNEKAYFVRDDTGKEYILTKDAVVGSMPPGIKVGWHGYLDLGSGNLVNDLNQSRGGTRVRIFALPQPAETNVIKVPLATKHDHL